MKYKLVIFDMDGTILNTLDDLCDSLNYSLTLFGFPSRTAGEVRNLVGNGIKRLVADALPPSAEEKTLESVYRTFCEYYKANCCCKTKPYDGVGELLGHLSAMGVKTAVVSNKAHFAVVQLTEKYFCGMFDVVLGQKEGIKTKPSPDSINLILEELGVAKSLSVYIGDSDIDVLTAKNAGIDCIAVDWGFRDRALLEKCGAKNIASTPQEVLALLKAAL